jgi:hypothetical protein
LQEDGQDCDEKFGGLFLEVDLMLSYAGEGDKFK